MTAILHLPQCKYAELDKCAPSKYAEHILVYQKQTWLTDLSGSYILSGHAALFVLLLKDRFVPPLQTASRLPCYHARKQLVKVGYTLQKKVRLLNSGPFSLS